MFEAITDTFHRLLQSIGFKTHRYLYTSFNINAKLTGIVGPRGVGKTTLMLQFIKEKLYGKENVFYFSADNIIFSQHTLLECIEYFYKTEDIRIFFIDEIHKYSNWDQELKNIYDSFPMIKVIFSGSSSIDLIHGSYDLSRRARLYHLHGLSFREYLNFMTQQNFNPISLDNLLLQNNDFSFLQTPKLQGHFNAYLTVGYYPFYFEDPESYYERVTRIIEKSIFEDIASFYNLKTENLHLFKKIILFLATIPPGNINTHNIARHLSIDDKTIFHYLTILNKVGLAKMIYTAETGNQQLRKPTKIFLDNTNLLYALDDATNTKLDLGTVRELFFIQSMMNAGIKLHYSKTGDFEANNIIFEIGGKNKTPRQIKRAEKQAFLVKDNISFSNKNSIPLFYFGFLY